MGVVVVIFELLSAAPAALRFAGEVAQGHEYSSRSTIGQVMEIAVTEAG
jgi:hypothetical protein